MTLRVTIIADDLTGAADTGVTFAAKGAETWVVWAGDAALGVTVASASVAVLSTESRHIESTEAIHRVSQVAERLRALTVSPGEHWIYKKIDSTLRGHPGVELAALAQGLGMAGALVAPALPSQGRSTRAGLQLVDGVPLTATVFGQEVVSSDVGCLLAAGFPEERIRTLPLKRVREGVAAVFADLYASPASIWLADAESDADLAVLARAACKSGIRLLCGSAGLAQALAEMLAGQVGWEPLLERHVDVKGDGQGVLVVAASRHPKTQVQVAAAKAAGLPIIRPAPAWFTEAAVTDITGELVEGLTRGAAVLTTAGLPEMPSQGSALTARLAQAVATLLAHHPLAGLVLTGGDAAIAVSQALRAEALRLHGEVAPGIPWGTLIGGTAPDLPVVTKAGGFGDEGALLEAVRFLCREILVDESRESEDSNL